VLILRGKSVLLAAALAAACPAPISRAEDVEASPAQTHVNFSFDQVDIRLLVKLVGEMTGRRFVVDDAVTGRVTVVTPGQIPVSEVYALFLSILESSGYSVVEKKDASYVVALPGRDLPDAPVVLPEQTTRPSGLITKVLKLRYISATELRKVLEPLIAGGKSGALLAFGATNHLILTDTGDNVARIESIVAELDQPGQARVVEVVELKHGSAADVARQLNQALLGAETAGERLSRHVRQVTEGGSDLPADVVIVPTPTANSLVLVGTSVQLAELKRVIEKMDVEGSAGRGRFNAIFLKYLSAEEAAKSLNALLAKTVEKEQRQEIAIEPSIENNALLVDAGPRDFELVRELVAQLDQVPQQVLVEILVAEVTTGDDLDLGVELATIDAPQDDTTTIVGRSRPDETDTLLNIVSNVFPQGLTFALSRGFVQDAQGNLIPRVPFLIKALAEDREVSILANVPLWAQNNKEASVSVVDDIPILTSTIEGSGTARDIIQTIERLDVGIKLSLTPHVNPQREVQLQLNPKIEAIVDEGAADTPFTPTIAKREVSTTVTVPDRSTVVISGLIREDEINEVSKVPLLGDIPVLGWLFRSTAQRKQRTNLLIFVTPQIVTDAGEAEAGRRDLEERTGLSLPDVRLSVDRDEKQDD